LFADQLHLLPVVLSMWVHLFDTFPNSLQCPYHILSSDLILILCGLLSTVKLHLIQRLISKRNAVLDREFITDFVCSPSVCIYIYMEIICWCTKSVFKNSKVIVFQNREQDLNP